MGSHSKIIGSVRVGYGSIIGAGAVVTKDIPPFSKVVGNPGKVVARYCMKHNSWILPDDVKEIMSEAEYIKKLKNNYSIITVPRYAASSRNGWI